MGHVRAILWAQWRALWTLGSAPGRAGRWLSAGVGVLWYAMWAGVGAGALLAVRNAGRGDLAIALPWVFLGMFLYWQLAPVLTASLGASLDLRKLLVYPIPERDLFTIEVLLRVTTGAEMLLVLTGVTAGLVLNPAVPSWAPLLASAGYAAFNLFLSAGVRSLLERALAYRRVRQWLVFLFVIAAALPQWIAYAGLPAPVRSFFLQRQAVAWPWAATAASALAEAAAALIVLGVWALAAFAFGRWQFHRGLRFDAAAAQSDRRATSGSRMEGLYRFPGLLLPDPLAAMVEKELRSLARSPRFRLAFFMGFTFGLLIWLPLFRSTGESWGAGEDLAVAVSFYAMILLAEVAFWNCFGFDRSAIQLYFAAPVGFRQVLVAKNLAALLFVLAEVTAILLALVVVRAPPSLPKVAEVYGAMLVLSVYMLAAGNLSSTYYPHPVSPEHTWGRMSGGKFQALLVFLLPLLGAPIGLAYLARYAWDSVGAFYGVLGLSAAAGAIVYWIAMDSAVAASSHRREALLAALAESGGPFSVE